MCRSLSHRPPDQGNTTVNHSSRKQSIQTIPRGAGKPSQWRKTASGVPLPGSGSGARGLRVSVPLVPWKALGPQPNPGPGSKDWDSAGAKSLESQCYYSTVVPTHLSLLLLWLWTLRCKVEESELRVGTHRGSLPSRTLGMEMTLPWMAHVCSSPVISQMM